MTEKPGGYSPWHCKELDMTEHAQTHTHSLSYAIFFGFYKCISKITMPINIIGHFINLYHCFIRERIQLDAFSLYN